MRYISSSAYEFGTYEFGTLNRTLIVLIHATMTLENVRITLHDYQGVYTATTLENAMALEHVRTTLSYTRPQRWNTSNENNQRVRTTLSFMIFPRPCISYVNITLIVTAMTLQTIRYITRFPTNTASHSTTCPNFSTTHVVSYNFGHHYRFY